MINYYLIILLIYLIIRFENHLFFPSEREEFEIIYETLKECIEIL